jgi:hypothetical protein
MANSTSERYMTVVQVIELIQLVDQAVAMQSVEKEGSKSVASIEQNPRGVRITSILCHHC